MSEVNGTDGISAGERVKKNGERPTHQTKGPGRTVTSPQRPLREETGGKRCEPAA